MTGNLNHWLREPVTDKVSEIADHPTREPLMHYPFRALIGITPDQPHPGGVHAPDNFGYDISVQADNEAWRTLTGEIPIVVASLGLDQVVETQSQYTPADHAFFDSLGET